MNVTKIIPVSLGRRSYDVTVGLDLLDDVGSRLAALRPERFSNVGIVTDSHVGPLYAAALLASVRKAGLAATVVEFPAGEQNKNLTTYASLAERLLALRPAIDRRSLLMGLGGGVVGDMAGFLAATLLRGIDFVNVPTTLLADVDASTGGKTGVDSQAGKNLIGAFHQPRAVLVDATLLKSLPTEQLVSGLGECVKHAIIRDQAALDFLEQHASALLSADGATLAEVIARNVAIKAAIVSADERESGTRALLNFGHTIGHAVETAGGYGAVSHGQAVALGMVAACRIALRRGLITAEHEARVTRTLALLHLPTRWADLPALPSQAKDAATLKGIMLHDKKALAGVVRFVLPVGLGDAALFADVNTEEVDAALAVLQG